MSLSYISNFDPSRCELFALLSMLDQVTAKEINMSKLEGIIPMAERPMIPPAAQAVAASGSSKGAPLFIAADPDLVAKDLQDFLRRAADESCRRSAAI
jgi:hypothetical protein